MDTQWLGENWTWSAAAVGILIVIYALTRPKKPSFSNHNAGAIVAALVSALENVVDGTIGSHFSQVDRQKIAVGMIAVMATDNITLEQLISDKRLFAAVMAKSVATLVSAGEISVH